MGVEAWAWMGAWALVMVGVVWLLVRQPRHAPHDDPMGILRDRFARGEISEPELRQALAALDDEPPPSPSGAHPATTHDMVRRSAMTDHTRPQPPSRRVTRRAERASEARRIRLRRFAFGGIVVAVLAVGGYLAFGDFLGRPADTVASGVIDVQSSMAGFTPSEIDVTAGQTVTFRWWTQDAAPHLTGGVHTMISPELGLAEQLPAESTKMVTWTVPNKPGTYDVWCESCCGGKDAPQMHGKIVVKAASAAIAAIPATVG